MTNELTEYEQTILVAIANGYTNKDIYATFGLTAQDLKKISGKIISKLDAVSMPHAVYIALSLDIIKINRAAN